MSASEFRPCFLAASLVPVRSLLWHGNTSLTDPDAQEPRQQCFAPPNLVVMPLLVRLCTYLCRQAHIWRSRTQEGQADQQAHASAFSAAATLARCHMARKHLINASELLVLHSVCSADEVAQKTCRVLDESLALRLCRAFRRVACKRGLVFVFQRCWLSNVCCRMDRAAILPLTAFVGSCPQVRFRQRLSSTGEEDVPVTSFVSCIFGM